MVHYAYVKNINSDSTYRYVIVFASRAVADEWWRAVSTSSNVKFSDSVRRVNAQFYTHDVSQANAANSLTTSGVATQFIGKVFFTLLNDLVGRGLSVIPSTDCVDYVSGNSFFIRSKVSPHEYWYCPLSSNSNATNSVYVSRTERTRFRVGITDKDTEGTIMIGSDEIVITLLTVNLSINVADNSQVMLSSAPESGLKFRDLLNKFTVGPTMYKDGQSLDMKELFSSGNGEEWELA